MANRYIWKFKFTLPDGEMLVNKREVKASDILGTTSKLKINIRKR